MWGWLCCHPQPSKKKEDTIQWQTDVIYTETPVPGTLAASGLAVTGAGLKSGTKDRKLPIPPPSVLCCAFQQVTWSLNFLSFKHLGISFPHYECLPQIQLTQYHTWVPLVMNNLKLAVLINSMTRMRKVDSCVPTL